MICIFIKVESSLGCANQREHKLLFYKCQKYDKWKNIFRVKNNAGYVTYFVFRYVCIYIIFRTKNCPETHFMNWLSPKPFNVEHTFYKMKRSNRRFRFRKLDIFYIPVGLVELHFIVVLAEPWYNYTSRGDTSFNSTHRCNEFCKKLQMTVVTIAEICPYLYTYLKLQSSPPNRAFASPTF